MRERKSHRGKKEKATASLGNKCRYAQPVASAALSSLAALATGCC